MKKKQIAGMGLAVFLAAAQAVGTWGMEAPGAGGENWFYDDESHHWYYREKDHSFYTGWLEYEGERYWFDSAGRMADGGFVRIGGTRYYFYGNGHMARNQYVGMKYYDGGGQHREEHDVQIVGEESPETEERDIFSDDFYYVPRSWIREFVADGWQLMYYGEKEYFKAPKTASGICYKYHDVDSRSKKVKFTRADQALRAFGEYVGYASGCYEKDSAAMDVLWEEYAAVNSVLKIPDYYAKDAGYYFGSLFDAYLREESRQDLQKMSVRACEAMEKILHQKDDEAARARAAASWKAEKAELDRQRERLLTEQKNGPGIK